MRKMFSKNQIESLSQSKVEEMRQSGDLTYQGEIIEIQNLVIDDDVTIELELTDEQTQIIDNFNLFHIQYEKYDSGAIYFAIVLKNKDCPSVVLDTDYQYDHVATIKLSLNAPYYLTFSNDESFTDVTHDKVYITPII